MLDTTTYLLTQDGEAGPIMRPEDPPLFDHRDIQETTRPLSPGQFIGGAISIALIAARGLYMFVAL